MTPQAVVEHFGTIAAAARALDIKGPSISGWIANGEIPIDRQCQIEVITGGRLVADREALNMVTPERQQAAGSSRNGQMT